MSSQFISELTKLILADGKYTQEEFTALLGKIKVTDGKCIYKFVKGDKEGQECGVKVSTKSETGEYCTRHLPKGGSTDGKTCKWKMTKGDRQGEDCGKKVSPKCEHGVACSAHLSHSDIIFAGTQGIKEAKNGGKNSGKKKDTDVFCDYPLATGNNKGKPCGKRVTEKSSSSIYCTTHASKDTGVKKATVPTSTTQSLKPVKEQFEGKKVFYFPDIGLVLSNDKKICAKYEEGKLTADGKNYEGGKFTKITAEDMEKVKSLDFHFGYAENALIDKESLDKMMNPPEKKNNEEEEEMELNP
jgi:hypothetical protein